MIVDGRVSKWKILEECEVVYVVVCEKIYGKGGDVEELFFILKIEGEFLFRVVVVLEDDIDFVFRCWYFVGG